MSTITVDDVAGLRVVKLREELKRAGLDSKGKKAQLAARLREHLQAASKKRKAEDASAGDDSDADSDVGPKAPKRARAGDDAATGGGGGSGSGSGSGAGSGAGAGSGGAAAAAPAAAEDGDDSSSDDDFGPAPAQAKKPKKALAHEKDFLDKLPSAGMYEKSYMHRDRISHIAVASGTDFVITASVDGHLKFWKKMAKGIEFVKHYRAHMGRFHGVATSKDGLRLCTTSEDKTMKFYDVSTFDMTLMVQLPYVPGCCQWIYRSGSATPMVAISDKASGVIRIYNADEGSSTPVKEIRLHRAPVTAMAFCPRFNVVVSGDEAGGLEYWSCKSFKAPKKIVKFRFKADTDLFALNRAKARVTSIDCSPDGMRFAVTASDSMVRVFKYRTGKLFRVYDDSPGVYEGSQLDGSLGLDAMDYGRRMAVERDLRNSKNAAPSNVLFDQTGHFIIFPTLIGVKVINIETNRTVAMLGKVENTERFLCIALFQGIPNTDTQMELLQRKGKPMAMADQAGPKHDPTIFCGAFKKNRFYMFTKREPDDSETADSRDVFNEAPRKEDRLVQAEAAARATLGSEAVIHTTLGDINVKLYAQECPRTVENFSVHSRNGYYNNLIFHRVIKSFMIQTGDPLGDGTGGESIWGGEFEDEIRPSLRHDRPFTLSMANGGPNTNGSQFFITTVKCPWLDGKHTVFGRVTKGMDVVTQIENVKVSKSDKPFEDIRIVSINIK